MKNITRLIILLCIVCFAVLTYINIVDRPVAVNEPVKESAVPTMNVTMCYPKCNVGDAPLYEAQWEPEEADVIQLAKMMFGECRGVKAMTLPDGRVIDGMTQKAACCWCAINRADADGWGDTLADVIVPSGFRGYSPHNPVWDELYDLARDVLIRWHWETIGYSDIGRVLPAEYTYFCSDGCGHNVFRDAWRSKDANKWTWELDSPYESEA